MFKLKYQMSGCKDVGIRNLELAAIVQFLKIFPPFPLLFQTSYPEKIPEQWPNLKNLSGGLNLSRGLNMIGST